MAGVKVFKGISLCHYDIWGKHTNTHTFFKTSGRWCIVDGDLRFEVSYKKVPKFFFKIFGEKLYYENLWISEEKFVEVYHEPELVGTMTTRGEMDGDSYILHGVKRFSILEDDGDLTWIADTNFGIIQECSITNTAIK